MANTNLANAKTGKNDEFYTQYSDIQKEINAYLEYDPNVFRGKTVLLPCDDPEWSNFTKFFAQNFETFGMKKLISTSYAVESKKIKDWQPTLFETDSPYYDADKSRTNGKIFILDEDINGDGRFNINDLQWSYLEGDGDFRSDEVKAWTFRKGMKAPQCAGIIHTDFERGFIRAEVTSYEDLIKYGSEKDAKDNGKVRLEGKEYLMQDGDICYFRFNV